MENTGCCLGTLLTRACLLSCKVGTGIEVSFTPWVEEDWCVKISRGSVGANPVSLPRRSSILHLYKLEDRWKYLDNVDPLAHHS